MLSLFKSGSKSAFSALRCQSRGLLTGSKAPTFTAQAYLPDGKFGSVKLDDYIGKKNIVLYFYPADFTPICSSEVPAYSMLQSISKDTIVLGCSTDTQFSHKAWVNSPASLSGLSEFEVNHPILADPSHEIAKAYDILNKDGLTFRGTFIIDLNGNVVYEQRNERRLGRNTDEPKRILDALAEADKQGRLIPANWKQGGDLIENSPKGVEKFLKTKASSE